MQGDHVRFAEELLQWGVFDAELLAFGIGLLTVALVGDIAHSRTARSNIWGLRKLGAHVIICGPPTLVSPRWAELGFETAHRLDEILPRCDVLNLLRVQFERQVARPFPSVHEYAALFRSRCQSSPLDGHELAGRVTYTIVDGTVRYHLLPDPQSA